MIKNLDNTYPFFKQGQLLTHDGLNDLRSYLDTNMRVNRSSFNGMGIVCGLEFTYQRPTVAEPGLERQIQVSKGMAITSEGYIVCLEDDKVYRHFDEEFSTDYNFQKSQANSNPIYKLTDDGSACPLSDLPNEGDWAVALMLEETEDDIDFCVNTSGDFGGAERSYKLCPVLVKKSDLGEFQNHTFVQREDYFNKFLMPREHSAFPFTYEVTPGDNTTEKTINKFGEVSNPKEFRLIYSNVIKNAQDSLANAMYNTIQEFVPYLGIQFDKANTENTLDAIAKTIDESIKNEDYYMDDSNGNFAVTNLQVVYDFYRHLTDALSEFLAHCRNAFKNCVPNGHNMEDCFRRHVALGALLPYTGSNDYKYNDEYRNTFVEKFVIEEKEFEIVKAQTMFEKMMLMLQNFEIPTVTDVLATPSLTDDNPLEVRAMPFYFKLNTAAELRMMAVWNGDWAIKRSWESKFLTYHIQKENTSGTNPGLVGLETSNPQTIWPFKYEILEKNFYRIEGHVGQLSTNATQALIDLRTRHNLSFAIKTVDIVSINDLAAVTANPSLTRNDVPVEDYGEHPDFLQFHQFMSSCPGAEHKGGVYRGGTFILITDGANVLGDFCLPPTNLLA